MTNLTDKFVTLMEQLASQNESILVLMGDINDSLGLLNLGLDTINNNAATNTKYLLNALGNNSPCIDCETRSLIVPPVSGLVNPINEEKCQRVQAFLHAIDSILTIYDGASAFSVGWNPDLISNAVTEALAQLENPEPIPNMSFPELVQGAGDLASYILSNITEGGTLTGYFASVRFDLQDAMFAASSVEDMKAAYDTIIGSSAIPGYAGAVLKDAAYSALVNYYFDPESTPNLTGFDGGVCSFPIGTCVEIEFAPVHLSSGLDRYAVTVPFGPFTPVTTINTSSGEVTGSVPSFFAGDLAGWTIEILTGEARVIYRDGGLESSELFDVMPTMGVTGIPQDLPAGTGSFAIDGEIALTSVRLCFAGV